MPGREGSSYCREDGRVNWQPIETAPKDVPRCLLWCSDYSSFKRSWSADEPIKMGRIMEGRPYGDGMNGDWQFSHWMPLPEPPEGKHG